MTPEEIQEIVDLVLQAIRTNSKTIEQLTEAFSVGNADYFELSGGRKISFATLAEFIETQGGLITTEQIADGAVTEAKTSFIKVVSDNMLNKADVLEGKLINSSTGALVNIQSIFTANYIPVKPSTDYWWLGTQTAYGYAFYDANKQLLSFGAKGTENDMNKPGHATSPEGAAYLRVSFPNSQIDTAQVNEGSWKTHDEYRFGIDDNLLPGDSMPINGARIINNTVTPDKTTFFITKRSSINLYNPAAATEGKYIVATTGALADSSTLCVSDYIPVKPGTEYFYYGRQLYYGYAFYNADKSRIAFGAKGTENDTGIGSKVAPEGAEYIRITFRIADNGTNEVNEGIPYLSKIPSQLDSIMGQQGSFASAASLASGGELALGTFPVYISKQLCMVFGCKFSTFASVTLGQRNGYVTVDSQNVYVYGNLSTGGFGLRQTVAHNLTISNYIRLMLFVEGTKVTDTTMNASLVVSTATGYTVIKLNSWYYTHGGEVYASVGQASTDASIGATCIDFRSPVWAFGDSYFGLSPARWPYVMRELGYFNYYFEGLGGGTSYDMYHEMERATKFGTPRYLLWCLGMNDQDPDNTTPSANWLAVFGHIKDYCSENGVQLILATIPNTPTRRNYAKNEVVKASGYRYIDFAKAVGAENAGSSWYTGMLHTDNVHPTELGAQALATQVLIDFPELMEICKTPAVGGGGGDPIDAYTKAEADARFVQPTYVDDKVNAAQGQMVFRDAYSQNIFTSDDVPAGNTISLKYVPLSSGSANVIVYDTSGAVLKRFELSSVVAGQEYTFDDYVLPDTYARVYVTNYQHLNVYVTVVGWSNKALFEAMGGKQDILTAGTNITIENNVISASGGGGLDLTVKGMQYHYDDMQYEENYGIDATGAKVAKQYARLSRFLPIQGGEIEWVALMQYNRTPYSFALYSDADFATCVYVSPSNVRHGVIDLSLYPTAKYAVLIEGEQANDLYSAFVACKTYNSIGDDLHNKMVAMGGLGLLGYDLRRVGALLPIDENILAKSYPLLGKVVQSAVIPVTLDMRYLPALTVTASGTLYSIFGTTRTNIETMGDMDFSKITNFSGTFNLFYCLRCIGVWDVSGLTGQLRLGDCKVLTNIGGLVGLSVSISFSNCPLLTRQSVLNIINTAADLSGGTTQTLTLHAEAKARLTDEDKALITAKGWTLA